MLDRKTKDIDASIELLEDRKKIFRLGFLLLGLGGSFVIMFSVAVMPYRYDEIGIGLGVMLLIYATWFFNNWNYLDTIILIKKMFKSSEGDRN